MLKKMLLLLGLLLGMFSVQAQTWYFEDFESLHIVNQPEPEGWVVPQIGYSYAFELQTTQGVDGSQTFYTWLSDADERYFITQEVNLGDEPIIEFQYKTMGMLGNEASENCLSLELSLITGENTTVVKTVSAENFVVSSTYALMRVELDKNVYAGQQAKVKLSVQRADDYSEFYIDNFGVGTKPEAAANDLMIRGAISGTTTPTVNTETEYTFTVFNNGTAAQTAYSVQLLNGTRTLLASEDITASLEAGASAQHTLKYTPTQTGTDKLYAVVVLANDENHVNDTATLNIDVESVANDLANDLMIQGNLTGPSMPMVNAEAEYTFTVFNNGTAAQTAYSVQLLNGTRTLLASEDITASLEAGASAQHTLKYTPTQTGTDKLYAVVVLANDENSVNDTATLNIDVLVAGDVVVEFGGGYALLNYSHPFGFSTPTNAALALYSPEELRYIKGTISSLMFEGKFNQKVTSQTQIYLGETDAERVEFDEKGQVLFIDPATLTKVFDGNTTFTEGDRQNIRFVLTQPYAYSGDRTLVVYTFTRTETGEIVEGWQMNGFYCKDDMGGNIMAVVSNGDNINPMQPDEGFFVLERPNTKFFFSSILDEKYKLAFSVKDDVGQTVSDAVITLNGESQETGKYVFEDMPARGYTYVIEKEGFIPVKGSLRLNRDTTLTVILADMANYPGLSGYLFEDFENIAQGKRPLNWSGDFYVDEKGGKNDGHRLTHSFWYMDGSRFITTNPIFMGSDPVFELEYRVMGFDENIYDYTGSAFAGENISWSIEVSTDFGETWKTLFNEDYGTHIASKDYKTFSLDVSAYAGKICQFLITVNRDYQIDDKFYFDIDNIKIGTQLEKELAVVSKIEGMRIPEAGVKTVYTVCVRNEGTAAAENYSLKFYDGETELGSVAGTPLESGAFVKLAFEYTFAEAGEHTLTAVCEMEDDELVLNNTTTEFYVSVQPKGVKSSIVEAYEGEDIAWDAPMSMYTNYSLNWLLYNQQDLVFESGSNINGMAFRTKFTQTINRVHVSIYIGETVTNSLIYGVPVPTSLTKVFDGVVVINDLDGGNLVINFDRAYPYRGKNIVAAVYTEVAQPFIEEVGGFYGYSSLDAVSVVTLRDDEPIDLSKIRLTELDLAQNSAFCKPSTIFLLNDNVSYYSVNFEVVDQEGKEVADATVTFDGTVMEAGQYRVENVPDGTYAYTVSLDDLTASGEVTVNGADVVEKVQLKSVANENKVEETMASIYPNPTDGKLHINVAQGAKEINLYDISGRSVRKISRVPAGIIELDMTDCHSGIYLLKIDNQAFKVSKR